MKSVRGKKKHFILFSHFFFVLLRCMYNQMEERRQEFEEAESKYITKLTKLRQQNLVLAREVRALKDGGGSPGAA